MYSNSEFPDLSRMLYKTRVANYVPAPPTDVTSDLLCASVKLS